MPGHSTRILRSLSNSKGFRDSAVMIVGNMASVSMSAVAMILISRLLGPELFGEFSVGFAIVLMLSRINDLGLTSALQKFVPRAEDTKAKNRIFSFSTRVKLLTSLCIAVLGITFTPQLAQILNFSNQGILYAAFIVNIATVFYEHLAAMLQSLHKVAASVWINAMQAGSKLLGVLLFWAVGMSGSALPFFTLYAAAPIVPVLFTSRLMPKWFKLKLRGKYQTEKKVLRTMASHAAVGFIAAGIIENIDVLFVQGYLNTYEAGLYAGASRIAMLFSLTAYSLANVLNPRVARYTAKIHLRLYLKKALLLIAFSALAFLMLIPLSRYLIVYTIGPEYISAAGILIILLASSFLTLATIPLISLFFSFKGAEWYFSLSGLVQLTIILGGSFLFVPTLGLPAAAWTRLVSKISLFLLTSLLAWRYYSKIPKA